MVSLSRISKYKSTHMVEDVLGSRDRGFDALLTTRALVFVRIPAIPELGSCEQQA